MTTMFFIQGSYPELDSCLMATKEDVESSSARLTAGLNCNKTSVDKI